MDQGLQAKEISITQLVMENWIGNEYVKGKLGVAHKWSEGECNGFLSLY